MNVTVLGNTVFYSSIALRRCAPIFCSVPRFAVAYVRQIGDYDGGNEANLQWNVHTDTPPLPGSGWDYNVATLILHLIFQVHCQISKQQEGTLTVSD